MKSSFARVLGSCFELLKVAIGNNVSSPKAAVKDIF
jgi:hypothetical protein